MSYKLPSAEELRNQPQANKDKCYQIFGYDPNKKSPEQVEQAYGSANYFYNLYGYKVDQNLYGGPPQGNIKSKDFKAPDVLHYSHSVTRMFLPEMWRNAVKQYDRSNIIDLENIKIITAHDMAPASCIPTQTVGTFESTKQAFDKSEFTAKTFSGALRFLKPMNKKLDMVIPSLREPGYNLKLLQHLQIYAMQPQKDNPWFSFVKKFMFLGHMDLQCTSGKIWYLRNLDKEWTMTTFTYKDTGNKVPYSITKDILFAMPLLYHLYVNDQSLTGLLYQLYQDLISKYHLNHIYSFSLHGKCYVTQGDPECKHSIPLDFLTNGVAIAPDFNLYSSRDGAYFRDHDQLNAEIGRQMNENSMNAKTGIKTADDCIPSRLLPCKEIDETLKNINFAIERCWYEYSYNLFQDQAYIQELDKKLKSGAGIEAHINPDTITTHGQAMVDDNADNYY